LNRFLLTMQYDEEFCLPIFLNHYSKYFPKSHIFIVDHGSSRDLVPAGYNRIFVPRDRPYSERSRLRLIKNISSGLLEYFDAGVYADCDELINLDALAAVDFSEFPVTYTAGFDVYRAETDQGRRLFGLLNAHLCKPSIFARTPNWLMGFHGCEVPPRVLTMPMAHIRYLFDGDSLHRLRSRVPIRQSMHAGEKAAGVGAQWECGDAQYPEFHKTAAERGAANTKILEFMPINAATLFQARVQKSADGVEGPVIYWPNGTWDVTDYRFDLTDQFPALS
jgi:hypothetical protein